MGIAIGAYMFNEKVRGRANRIIISLFTSIMNYMQTGKMKKQATVKRTVSAPRQASQEAVGYKTNGAVKSLKQHMQCDECGSILIPCDGQFKGSGVCSQCQHMQQIK
jgi:hypothetical protein